MIKIQYGVQRKPFVLSLIFPTFFVAFDSLDLYTIEVCSKSCFQLHVEFPNLMAESKVMTITKLMLKIALQLNFAITWDKFNVFARTSNFSKIFGET